MLVKTRTWESVAQECVKCVLFATLTIAAASFGSTINFHILDDKLINNKIGRRLASVQRLKTVACTLSVTQAVPTIRNNT